MTGTVILPGVEVTLGSETATVNTDVDAEETTCDPLTVVDACSLEKTGAILLCNPKNSVVESIKAKCEPPAPSVVIPVSRASRIATKAKPLTREIRRGFWLRNII